MARAVIPPLLSAPKSMELGKGIPPFSLVTLLIGQRVLSLSIIHVRRDVLMKLMPDTVVHDRSHENLEG